MKRLFDNLLGLNVSVAALLLRILIGGSFIVHGYPKLVHYSWVPRSWAQGRNRESDWLRSIGLPGGFFLFAGVVEFFGGVAVLLGVLTSIVALLFAAWMLSTTCLSVMKVTKRYTSIGGYDVDVTLLLASLALAIIGGGTFSIDHVLGI